MPPATVPAGDAPVARGSESVQPSAGLPLQLLDHAARRLAGIALTYAVVVVAIVIFQRLAQPALAPLIDDPVNRLVALASVLMGLGLAACRRYRVVTSRTLLTLGMAFEILVALTISVFETARPFDADRPLLGLSGVGPWLVFVGAAIPSRPSLRLGLALAAASMWPLAYWANSIRFGFVTESWRQTSIWPTMNYLFAFVAYLMGRWTYGTAREVQSARDLGSYRLEALIGEGGMGDVWRASHKMLVRPAAIKLVKPDPGREEIFARRFQREANAIAGLESPHTVYLYDFGTTEDGRLYYVMELLDGISLQTLINTFGPQPAARVICLLKQVCQSLGEAHAKQLVHRDLKPSNVMICKVAESHDFVKVLDFGLAKPLGNTDQSMLTAEGITTGTPGYMAPEVALGHTSIDGRADLYALGCVGYELLTGTLVFPDANPMTMALKHVQAAPDPPSRRTDLFIPPDLERVILACLAKEPDARPSGANEVERMLDACDVSRWTEREAADWWHSHLSSQSPLRSFAQSSSRTPALVHKA